MKLSQAGANPPTVSQPTVSRAPTHRLPGANIPSPAAFFPRSTGNFLPWFHGLISRKESEELLAPRYIGCFLVRVSENRFGYTLSYRVSDRCRHYMVEQDTHGRYALVGVPKVCNSLNELIEWFSRNRVNEDGDMLREPCGQAVCHWEKGSAAVYASFRPCLTLEPPPLIFITPRST
jgi:hypothetical protein